MKLSRLSFAVAGLATVLMTAHAVAGPMEITPSIQSALEKQKATILAWAADPVIVRAVQDQNSKGPLTDMDNVAWKKVRRTDTIVTSLQSNDAGKWLKAKADESHGLISEVFLNAAAGEKVAFLEKTSSYIHKGKSKFDVPLSSGATWQGDAEFDESSQTYAIQIAVPVKAEGHAIGVLVVGVNLSQLEKTNK